MFSRRQLANVLRVLSIDAVERANSGHPGMPLGMADIAEVLWNDFLHHNPKNPNWSNRDRFILSNGHGCMLQYSLLHLTGYDLTLDDLKNFRQLHSKTPGHPELGTTPGVETTTGPLGQGLANAVGMAIAEKILSTQFNRDHFNIIDHYTYVFLGDGCLMEGISHEVCSLAGMLGLGKLIAFWDNNGISIDGRVAGWFRDDTPKRFEAYGWHVVADVDGHNAQAVRDAILSAQREINKPTLICCSTTIGFGSPNKADTAGCHGAPLGKEEAEKTRKQLGWEHPPFVVPNDIYAAWNAVEKGLKLEKEWQASFNEYKKTYPKLAAELQRRFDKKLPELWEQTWEAFLKQLIANPENVATRKASLEALEAFGPILPELIGGSADLSESNLTKWSQSKTLSHKNSDANYIHYGVRELGMSGIMNGLALYDGFIPYGGTFLVFYSYAASAVRMAALMKQRVIFIYTHDSIGLGEDGPTHQPIEQAEALRVIPNMSVWRPCDTVETAVAWRLAIERVEGPTALLLSRQTVPFQERTAEMVENIKRGGYILKDCGSVPEGIIIATGSEVQLAVEAFKVLSGQCVKVRIVSMPSTDVFLKQDENYKESILPSKVKVRVAVEASTTAYWHQFVGDQGKVIGINRFGESAPMKDLFEEFNFTVDHVVKSFKTML
jgi:transketolase